MNINYPLKFRLNIFGHPANGMLPGPWFQSIYQFGCHWSEVPKAVVISILVLLNYPFALMERMLFHKKMTKITITNPIFIIGHPRSGTTFLHYLLSRDDRFATPRTYQTILPNTFLLFGWIFKPMLSRMMPSKRPMDDMTLGPNEPKEEEFALASTGTSFALAYYFPRAISTIFKQFVLFDAEMENAEKWRKQLLNFSRKVCYDSGNSMLLLKSPYNTARINHILQVFPEARFIHIHRAPMEVYQSNRKLYSTLLPMLSLQRVAGEVIEEFILTSYVKVYAAYFKEKEKLKSSQLIEISYADLIKDPLKSLSLIYERFDLGEFSKKYDVFQNYLNVIGAYRADNYPEIEKENHEVRLKWAAISRQLGYD